MSCKPARGGAISGVPLTAPHLATPALRFTIPGSLPTTPEGKRRRDDRLPRCGQKREEAVAPLSGSPRRQFLASSTCPLLFLPGAPRTAPRTCAVVLLRNMAKKQRTASRFSQERTGRAALLAKLSRVVEVTASIRPRLLLMASVAEGQLMLGVLYHTRKDAFQSRLHVRSSGHAAFSHRSRWKKYASGHTFETQKQKMVKDFTELAVTLGAVATLHFEFLPQASDAEILQPLSSLLSVLLS